MRTIEETDDVLRDWYSNWNKDSSKYYAYIYVDELEEPIGEIYYYLKIGISSMGILI